MCNKEIRKKTWSTENCIIRAVVSNLSDCTLIAKAKAHNNVLLSKAIKNWMHRKIGMHPKVAILAMAIKIMTTFVLFQQSKKNFACIIKS